jgi:large subunit ribosomal protein L17
VRHRVAGNRINMPEARRRAAFRSMIDGLVLFDHITTTEARAKAVKSEAEHMIALALRGRREALAHVMDLVKDESIVQQLWVLAGEANFSLDSEVASNEERLKLNKVPLRPETHALRERELQDRKNRLLAIIKDKEKAQAALTATREARAKEVHARRTIMKHLPNPAVIRKLFSPEFQERFTNRNGGYTRIVKLGRRVGDGAEMVRLELVEI